MSYTEPEDVTSPRDRISDLEVVHNGGEGGWSLAKMKWDDEDAIGLRWNGASDDPEYLHIGNPQSRGVPTWFILPKEISDIVENILRLNDVISS